MVYDVAHGLRFSADEGFKLPGLQFRCNADSECCGRWPEAQLPALTVAASLSLLLLEVAACQGGMFTYCLLRDDRKVDSHAKAIHTINALVIFPANKSAVSCLCSSAAFEGMTEQIDLG